MRSWDSIVQIVEARRAQRGPLLNMMMAVRERYQADYVIPDPTGASDDPSPIVTPALIAQAIDQPAQRAASVLPNIYVPALHPNKLAGAGSMKFAAARRGALLATWDDSRIPLMLRRAYRHLRAYNTAAWSVEPCADDGMVKIRVRDPLSTFPELKNPEDLSLPSDCAFVFSQSAEAIRRLYPLAMEEHGGPVPDPSRTAISEEWDICEWIDGEVIVFGLLGPRYPGTNQREQTVNPQRQDMELTRYENKAGCCGVVSMMSVTLDQISSQVAKVIGHVDLAGQIMGLEIAAAQKAIWPDRYIIGKGAAAPSLVNGPWKEGRTGEANIILDASQVGELRGSPDPSAERISDRLERNVRVSTGLVPQMGGETYGALRTGRGIDTLGSWAVDPGVQELQELMQYALESVNEAVIKTYTGYYPTRKYTIFYGLGGTGAFAEFTPNVELAEDFHNKVSYAIAGADKQATTIQLGQQIGAKLISHHTARLKHPDVDDAEAEGRRILEEELDEALKVGLLQRASAPDSPGAIAPEDMAKIRDYVRKGEPLDQAVLKVNAERKETQAEQMAGPMGEEMGEPMPGGGNPAAAGMPGLAGPQEGVGQYGQMHSPEAPGMGIEGPTAALDRFKMLTGALRSRG